MDSLIDDLLTLGSLPDNTEKVSLVQIHISYIFITDDFVYKVKKAVNFGFLDFSTLEKRRYLCDQEVGLNRTLSKVLYIGFLPVIFNGRIHKIGEGRGKVVEYAVKMKRIHDEILMKSIRTPQEDCLGPGQVHLTAQRSAYIDNFGNPEVFKVKTDENFQQTEQYIGVTIKRDDFKTIKKLDR